MRPPKILCWTVLTAMLPQLTACHSFAPYEGSLPNASVAAESEREFKITTLGGDAVVLDRVWVESDSLHGFLVTHARSEILDGKPIPASGKVVLALEQIESLESRRISPGGTMISVGLIGYVVVGAVLAILCSGGACDIIKTK